MVVAFAIVWLVAGAAFKASPAQPAAASLDVCTLLGAEDIRAVQGVALKDRRKSGENVRGLDFAQCFFAAADFTRSVSLTVISGDAKDGARGYWQDTFHRRPPVPPAAAPAGGRKKEPPRSIDGAGDEAFWTGDARAGALYVLSGDRVLRISVGGVTDPNERLRRSTTLAKVALEALPRKR
ncbi:MAG TPA: hypothetical protein VNJ04_01555 [Gemmatimonadaceae bacterium]|nr:hypothetical protein [Gemmatimonadaceae bacterium]